MDSLLITLGPADRLVSFWIWFCSAIGTTAGAGMIVLLIWHRFFKRLPQQLVLATTTAQFLFAASQLVVSIWALSVQGRPATFTECETISSVRFVALALANLGNSAILFAFYYMIKSVRHFRRISWTPLKKYLVGMGSFSAITWVSLVIAFTMSVRWAYLSTGFCFPIAKTTDDNTFLSISASLISLVPLITGIIIFALAFREKKFFVRMKRLQRQDEDKQSNSVDELCGYFNFYRALSISWFICQFPFGFAVILAIPFSSFKVIQLARIIGFQWQGVQPVLDLAVYLYYLPGPFAQKGIGTVLSRPGRSTNTSKTSKLASPTSVGESYYAAGSHGSQSV